MRLRTIILLAMALLVTLLVYWPGLSGGYIFDDYPNIVENQAIHITHASPAALTGAALSSTVFSRPLASLSFALNYLGTGLDPWPMKLTNLLIHLCNGLLLFGMLHALLRLRTLPPSAIIADDAVAQRLALLVTAGWLLLPINLTTVLYVVQRMESLAQLAVLGGLWGYLCGRRRMLMGDSRGLTIAAISLVLGVVLGVLSKESAVLLPMYAFLVECTLLRFANKQGQADRRLIALYLLVLALPATLGLVWLLPKMLEPAAYASRSFTLVERLLTEPRILVDYLRWTLFPDPRVLSLYHDDLAISHNLLSPSTTLAAIIALAGLFGIAVGLRKQQPLVALGILWFLAAHLLTATIVPLELVFEHRNYFASIGVLLAVFAPLLGLRQTIALPIVRGAIVGLLLVLFGAVTLLRAQAWSNPILLAVGEADRHQESTRANYEAGRELLIASNYNRALPSYGLARDYLNRADALPGASTLSLQALLMMAAHSGQPVDPALWERLIVHLRTRPVTEEDISALVSLGDCRVRGSCRFDIAPLGQALNAAVSHPNPRPRLLGAYADYARQLLHDDALTEHYLRAAIAATPGDPGYRIGLTQLLAIRGRSDEALQQIEILRKSNTFGRLDKQIDALEGLIERYAPAAVR